MYNFNNVTLETKHIIIIMKKKIPFVPSPALIMVLGSVVSFSLDRFSPFQKDTKRQMLSHIRAHARARTRGATRR